MRPLKLEVCAWGPYSDKQVIDFEPLWNKGLFLITGATGAGKTSIFDGITYALFGEASGELREKDSMRSDFAKEEMDTYVFLKFAYKNKIYEVFRTPKYLRKKKRGDGFTESKEDASLKIDGETSVVGTNQVTTKIIEIIGIDYKQFKQISMLAQGEFKKLLVANSKDRTAIFRDIFNTRIYDTILSLLNTKSKNLYQEIKNSDNRLEELVSALHFEEKEQWAEYKKENRHLPYHTIIDKVENELVMVKNKSLQNEAKINALDLQIKTLIIAINDAKYIEDRLDKFEQVKNKLQQLNSNQEQIDVIKEKLQLAQKAIKVKPFEILALESQEVYHKKKKENEVLQKKIEELTSHFQVVKKQYNEIPDMREQMDFLKNKEQMLSQCLGILKDYAKEQTLLAKRQKEFLRANDNLRETKTKCETVEEILKKAAIGLVAKTLVEGVACPVCGSLQHPKIAQISDEIPDEKELKELRQKVELLQEETNKRHMLATESISLIKKYTLDYSSLCNQTAFHFGGIDEDSKDLNRMQTELMNCKNQMEKYKEMIEKTLESFQTISIELETSQKVLESSLKEMQSLASDAQNKLDEFVKVMNNQTFTDSNQYKNASVSDKEMDHLKDVIQTHLEDLKSTKDQYEILLHETKDKSRTNSKEFEEKLAVLENEKKIIEKDKEQANAILFNNNKILFTIKEKLQDKEKFEEEYGFVKDLENITRGNNPCNLIFEQYVLSVYFDNILSATNKRFMQMTDQRYELFRVEEAQSARSKDSLEIEVMDYYTGKTRSVKSLSGGESFKAALALAFGMSDTIKNYSGAIEINTMFIDEGFGALDVESLNQAIDALTSLANGKRLIGIISHVEELKDRIENQIIVEKTNVGSKII